MSEKKDLRLEAEAYLEAIENIFIVAGPKHEERMNDDKGRFFVDKLREVHNAIFSESNESQ